MIAVEGLVQSKAAHEILQKAGEAGIPFLGAVPFDPELARAGDRGDVFVQAHPAREAAVIIRAIAAAIEARLASTPSA